MKKILILSLFSLLLLNVFSQENKATQGKSEIKLNLLYTVIGYPEFTFEHIFQDKQSVGMNLTINLDTESYMYNFFIQPYYRYYLGRKKELDSFLRPMEVYIIRKNIIVALQLN